MDIVASTLLRASTRTRVIDGAIHCGVISNTYTLDRDISPSFLRQIHFAASERCVDVIEHLDKVLRVASLRLARTGFAERRYPGLLADLFSRPPAKREPLANFIVSCLQMHFDAQPGDVARALTALWPLLEESDRLLERFINRRVNHPS